MTQITISGHLRLEITSADGSVEVREHDNLVVDTGTHVLARALFHDTGSYLGQFKAGTDNTAPAVGQSDLIAPVFTKLIDTTLSQDNVVTVNFTMDTTEGNGTTYYEWGLFDASGIMVARWVDLAIAKTSSNQIQGSWTITIST